MNKENEQAVFSHEIVEAAGIEKASTPTKSSTYSRNRCLKSASWTFASRWNATHGRPSFSKQVRRVSVSCSPSLPALTTIGADYTGVTSPYYGDRRSRARTSTSRALVVG